ncbi:polysaccharide biosynthesis tyrosine autokinase [Bifidobacterium sp. ESL0775]|uniref:polysaccharide biosynthesis tyrosine autokinase n=1 Tax=Bifidobacterium sp. ESL0775 TaxID=2983230 RepID=UPI0023F7A8B4|nr:polysaccharide biosynthesis tyrosine autokinase [Bifidobacterium sp. ESL0775]WEV69110.1 polysaccharide biosynthesis tyrosine autokinase [Bifidobacterium sp. ESL0775]
MAIADVLAAIRKHLWAAVCVCFVFVAAAAAFAFLVPAQYRATSELFASYSGKDVSALNSSEMNSGATYLTTQIKTYPQLVKTAAVLQPVIDDLNLGMSVSDLSSKVTATNPAGTFMLNITVQTHDSADAAKISNAVAGSLRKQVMYSIYGGQKGQSPVDLSIVQRAQTPKKPSSPNKPLYLLAGLLIGIFAAVLLALLLEVLNTKVGSVEDAHAVTQGSSLGMVPKTDLLKSSRPVVISNPNSAEAEDFRRIRSNIGFLTPDSNAEDGKLIVITSSRPSEGKTLVTCNLAAALAEDDKTVLLIDADLRHPSVAHRLNIEGYVGLSAVLSGQATPMDVVQEYWKSNLQIFPAGKRPGNASILLGSKTMKALVKQARKQYDYVIIDTAPLSVSNDGTVFGQWANGVVMVVGKELTEKKELQSAVDNLKTAGVPLLGFVLNFADQAKIDSKNYYYYTDDSTASHKKGNKR